MPREHLSESIKRQLRQRAGFGCVMCGCPIYDYEHIVGYNVTGHALEHMTILCAFHHREKTAGRLPVAEVRAAAAMPWNLSQTQSGAHPLYFREPNVEIRMGSLSLEYEGARPMQRIDAIRVDGGTVLGFRQEDGRVLINARFRDSDNQQLLSIDNSQLTYSISSWDIRFEGKKLSIRQHSGQVSLEVIFDPPRLIDIRRMSTWANGVHLVVTPEDGLEIKNSRNGIAGLTAVMTDPCSAMVVMGNDFHRKTDVLFGVSPDPKRYLGGYGTAVSHPPFALTDTYGLSPAF